MPIRIRIRIRIRQKIGPDPQHCLLLTEMSVKVVFFTPSLTYCSCSAGVLNSTPASASLVAAPSADFKQIKK